MFRKDRYRAVTSHVKANATILCNDIQHSCDILNKNEYRFLRLSVFDYKCVLYVCYVCVCVCVCMCVSVCLCVGGDYIFITDRFS